MNPLRTNDYWKANENYTSSDRYRPIIVHDYKLYICVESHTSTNDFNDNIDKFIKIGGGGSITPAGTWDIAANTIGPNAVPSSLAFDSNFNVEINNNNFKVLDDKLWAYGGITFGGVSTAKLNTFTETKWFTIEAIDNGSDIFACHIIISNSTAQDLMTYNNIYGTFFGNSVILHITKYGDYGSYLSVQVDNNGISGHADANLAGMNSIVNIGINPNGQILIKSGSVDLVVNIALPAFTINTLLNIITVKMDEFLVRDEVKLYPVSLESPPLQMSPISYEVTLPQDASDGSVWEVTNNGYYNTTKLSNGDFVVFYNDLEDVIVLPSSQNNIRSLQDTINALRITTSIMPPINKQVSMAGKINHITNTVNPNPESGTVLLTLDAPTDPTLLPFTLYVFINGKWVKSGVINGNYLYYYNDSQQVYIHYGQQSAPSDIYTGIEPFTTLNNSSSAWKAVAPFAITGQHAFTVDNYHMYIPLAEYGSLYCELIDTYSVTEFTPNADLWSSFRSMELKLFAIKNPTTTLKQVRFLDVSMSLPFTNNIVSILPGKTLVVGYREVDNSGHTTQVEYVSGEYKNTEVIVPADQTVYLKNIKDIYIKYDANASVMLQIEVTNNVYTTFNIYYNATAYTGQISIAFYNNNGTLFHVYYTPVVGKRNQLAIINNENGWIMI